MADDADRAGDRQEIELERSIAAARGYVLPEGKAGDCDGCGEWAGRLIKGFCAPCRDKYGRD